MTANRIAIAPNTQPTFIKRGGILNSVRLTNQVSGLNGQTGGSPVVLYDPSLHGDGNGGIAECIRIYPAGVNVQSVLYLYAQMTSITPVRWDCQLAVALPAVTAVPNNALPTSAGTYPIEIRDNPASLPPILFPASQTPSTPNRGLRLNAEGVIWGVALGTEITSGVNVTMIGGEL